MPISQQTVASQVTTPILGTDGRLKAKIVAAHRAQGTSALYKIDTQIEKVPVVFWLVDEEGGIHGITRPDIATGQWAERRAGFTGYEWGAG